MSSSNKKWLLVKKEFIVEFRGGVALYDLILYLVGSTFVCYLALGESPLDAYAWSTFFWIILLFTSLSATSKIFSEEKKKTELYCYMIASPSDIIISKIIYNSLLCIFLGLFGYAFFSLLLQSPIQDQFIFMTLIVLVSIGFASSLTLLAYIASATTSNFVLMPILSFPITSSILLLAIGITKNCVIGLGWEASLDELISLFAVNSMLASVSYILFPYIWKG